jgi:hypothetical protein
MTPYVKESRWDALQANAHRPEIQEQIRREIRKGTIRVRPATGGGIRILAESRAADRDETEIEFGDD